MYIKYKMYMFFLVCVCVSTTWNHSISAAPPILIISNNLNFSVESLRASPPHESLAQDYILILCSEITENSLQLKTPVILNYATGL